MSEAGSSNGDAPRSAKTPARPGQEGELRAALAVIHHHPGRLRVRAEALRSVDVAARVQVALEVEPGLTVVAHTPKTGSLLIEYQPGLADPEAILARIAGAAGLALASVDARAARREPGILAVEAAQQLNELAYELTGYRADLRTLVPVGLATLAAYSFVVGKDRLPRWDNLLYWSYNIFSQLHRREIDAAGRAPVPAAPAPSKPAS